MLIIRNATIITSAEHIIIADKSVLPPYFENALNIIPTPDAKIKKKNTYIIHFKEKDFYPS